MIRGYSGRVAVALLGVGGALATVSDAAAVALATVLAAAALSRRATLVLDAAVMSLIVGVVLVAVGTRPDFLAAAQNLRSDQIAHQLFGLGIWLLATGTLLTARGDADPAATVPHNVRGRHSADPGRKDRDVHGD